MKKRDWHQIPEQPFPAWTIWEEEEPGTSWSVLAVNDTGDEVLVTRSSRETALSILHTYLVELTELIAN